MGMPAEGIFLFPFLQNIAKGNLRLNTYGKKFLYGTSMQDIRNNNFN